MEVEERRRDLQEDGWGDLFDKRRPIWRKLLKFPFRVAKKVLQATKEPGTLILVRHGESEWNANRTLVHRDTEKWNTLQGTYLLGGQL